MTSCKFFAQGFCKNGDSCKFIHEPDTSTGQEFAPFAPILPTTEKISLDPATITHRDEEAKPAQNCWFFLQGKCNKGEWCRYAHPPAVLSPQQVPPESIYLDSPQSVSDSRATVPCRFLSRPGGCLNSSCPYLHVADEAIAVKSSNQDLEANGEEASSPCSDSLWKA